VSEPKARTPESVLEWLKAHPDEPFWFAQIGSRIVFGARCDTGEVDAWECTVVRHVGAFDRRPRRRK
jgi:hypothetical protein